MSLVRKHNPLAVLELKPESLVLSEFIRNGKNSLLEMPFYCGAVQLEFFKVESVSLKPLQC